MISDYAKRSGHLQNLTGDVPAGIEISLMFQDEVGVRTTVGKCV